MQPPHPKQDPTRRPTRNDVAELAGVSTAVVSYVMNDGPRKVAPATRQRVLDAVAELGYRPNQIARSLRAQSTHMIGLIGHALGSAEFSAIATGVSDAAVESSYLLTVSNTDADPEQGVEAARLLVAKQVDGVVLVPGETWREVLDAVRAERMPVVVAGEQVEGVASVFTDPAAAADLAVTHLISLGHERIAVVGRVDQDDASRRQLEGYSSALREHGMTLDDDLVIKTDVGVEAGHDAAKMLLDLERPPTAVITQNDLTTLGLLDGLQHRGVAVPRDVSVVGADDLDLGQHLTPPLTTVPTRGVLVGHTAATLLLQTLGDHEIDVSTAVEPKLVLRASTGERRPT